VHADATTNDLELSLNNIEFQHPDNKRSCMISGFISIQQLGLFINVDQLTEVILTREWDFWGT